MNVALRLPDSLGNRLREFSKAEQISMNQFIATAVAEKLTALDTFDYLNQRASNGSIEHFKAILSKVPNRKPLKGDEL
jgi:HicB family